MKKPILKRRLGILLAVCAGFVSVSVPVIIAVSANEVSQVLFLPEGGKIGLKYTLRGFRDGRDFEAMGHVNVTPGVEEKINGADLNFALTATEMNDSVTIASRIFGSDPTSVIASHTLIVAEGASARIELGEADNGDVSSRFFLTIQHMKNPDGPYQETVKVPVPFKELTPIKDTIKRMAQLTGKRIILPAILGASYHIQIEAKQDELAIEEVISAYRVALAKSGLDLQPSDDESLSITKMGQ